MPLLYSYSIRDSDGDVNQIVVPVQQGALTLAQILEGQEVLGTLLDEITGGVITGMNLGISRAAIAAWKDDPDANTEVQLGANFGYLAAGTSYRHTIRIPGFKPALFVGDAVDTGDPDVAAFNTAILGGITVTGGSVLASDKYDNDLTGLLTAVKSHRRK